MKDIRFNFII